MRKIRNLKIATIYFVKIMAMKPFTKFEICGEKVNRFRFAQYGAKYLLR